MKIQLCCLFALTLWVVTACQPAVEQSASADEAAMVASEAPDYAAFDKKVAVIRSFIQAHSDEDINAQSALLSDTLKWSPPYYNGNEWLGKEDYVAALQAYHDGYENIKFTEGIAVADTLANGMWSGSVFPEGTATNSPTAIRIYGTWTATHTESGKDVGVKWFALGWVNDAGKVAQFTEYFDAHGLAAQVAAD